MATCDCSGASRAYVIVNPNSVNRREILSLNPPICHDVKTKGLLINGSPWTAPKEIQSWDIEQQQGGDEPLWSNDPNDGVIGGLDKVYLVQCCNRFSGTCVTHSIRWKATKTGELTWTTWSGPIPIINGVPATSCNYPGPPATQRCANFHTHVKITPYPVQPSCVIPSEPICVLRIVYIDDSTQEFTYSECPTVEPLQCLEVSDQGGVLADICPYNGEQVAFQCDERKCPPETCCELECGGGRVCCYGPDSGTAIDSFIRRT